MEESPFEYINEIDELLKLHEFMQDDYFSEALDLSVKCIMKPAIPPDKALPLIVKFQAYATKFKMQATFYMALEPGKSGTDNYKRKNVYFAMADQCEKLSAALKYLGRDG